VTQIIIRTVQDFVGWETLQMKDVVEAAADDVTMRLDNIG